MGAGHESLRPRHTGHICLFLQKNTLTEVECPILNIIDTHNFASLWGAGAFSLAMSLTFI